MDPDIYTDKTTGTKTERPGLENALSHLRKGDAIVVWRLDRLARSLSNLIELVNRLSGQGIAFKASPSGSMRHQLPGNWRSTSLGHSQSLSETSKERTIAGLSAVRARGRMGGRPRLDAKSGKVALARKLYADKSNAISDICKTLHISRATLYRYVK